MQGKDEKTELQEYEDSGQPETDKQFQLASKAAQCKLLTSETVAENSLEQLDVNHLSVTYGNASDSIILPGKNPNFFPFSSLTSTFYNTAN